MSEQLKSEQSVALRDAILKAYRKAEDFSEMLLTEGLDSFEQNTPANSTYRHRLIEYISYMTSQGKAETLIRSACNRRNGNQDLLQVCNQILSELGLEECKSGVLSSEQRPKSVEPGWEGLASVQLHNFDLVPLINACLPHLLRQKGLKAFLVPVDPEKIVGPSALLKNFCERIKADLEDSSKVFVSQYPLNLMPALASLSLSVSSAVTSLGNLSDGDVVLPVTADDEATALEFWEKVTAAYAGIDITHRGIAVIIVNTSTELVGSDEVVVLPKPECDPLDVYRWVNALVTALQWPKEAITTGHWENIIVQKCTIGILQFYMIYERLGSMLRYLSTRSSYKDFQRDYLERNRIP
jgi:hypothetical protein